MLALQLVAIPVEAQTLPTALNVVVVDGEGATGPVRQRAPHIPVVRVLDEKQNPVSGASVVFTLPTEGATGVFGNGSKTLMVMTDQQGTASAQGLRFTETPGKVPVNVNVSYKGLTARTIITELSEAPAGYQPSKGGHKGVIIALLVVLAAGGGAGAYLATRKSGSPATTTPAGPQPIGITPGTGTLAPPH